MIIVIIIFSHLIISKKIFEKFFLLYNQDQPCIFGHTIASDGKELVLLFGGAFGKTTQCSVTNRIYYSFEKVSEKWKEIVLLVRSRHLELLMQV